ncbi:MAG: phosphate acetyltransferase [Turicibacter sp.]|nr:phosphate acetyltransferase [Turicibacter sp.]
MDIMTSLKNKIHGKGIGIVFPEGNEPRVVQAASLLARENMLHPIVIGNPEEVKAAAGEWSLDGVEIIDPSNYDKLEEMVQELVKVRKGKATEEQAREMVKNVNYFGTMLVHMNLAAGLVSGAIHSTGDTIRPALQIIKTKPGVSKTFGYFAMLKEAKRRYIFADCAVNPSPTSSDIAEFAVESAKAARMFNIDPKVALLSFSTLGSAKTEETKKMSEAKAILDGMETDFDYDGELQFDAALVEGVGKLKAPNSSVAGQANVFVFPCLNSGNIGYKIAQRLGGYEAIGPILAGLNKPVNDLSRGCSAEDVYSTAIITANQSLL